MHHTQHAGLQDHSVGSYYPWTVSAKHTYAGIEYYAWNTVSGEQGPQFPAWSNYHNDSGHSLAESWIEDRLARDQAETAKRNLLERLDSIVEKELSEIIAIPDTEHPTRFVLTPRNLTEPVESVSLSEYTFLVPVVRNTSKSLHSDSCWQWLYGKLSYLFHGYTLAGTVSGSWIDSEGLEVSEDSRVVRVAIPDNRKPELLEVLETVKVYFDQETIYLAKTSPETSLV